MVIKVDKSNLSELTSLALKLWPDHEYEELYEEFSISLNESSEESFLYQDNSKEIIGFIQLSLRYDYVEGSNSSPVGYIEGIYVNESERRKRIAHELVESAEEWAIEKGCSELASDCEMDNILSIDFHIGVGFKEANRLVCFIKNIKFVKDKWQQD